MAVGIGLVFGVMRLVNFAYGQLIMAGAFALAFASERDWPVGVGIALCFAVVLALSLAMERVVFRPLRDAVARRSCSSRRSRSRSCCSRSRSSGSGRSARPRPRSSQLNRPVDDRRRRHPQDHDRRDRHRGGLPRCSSSLLLNRTSIGLHMRAAAIDSQTARLLGVRANLVSTVCRAHRGRCSRRSSR